MVGFLEEKYGIALRKTYNWDSPDGKDCGKKFAHSVKFGATVGGIAAFYDLMFLSQSKGFLLGCGRVYANVVPGMVLGGLYSVTACTLGQIRQEDGPLNHFAAGVAVGAAIASKYGGFTRGVALAPLIGLVAVVHKMLRDEDKTSDLHLAIVPQSEFRPSSRYFPWKPASVSYPERY